MSGSSSDSDENEIGQTLSVNKFQPLFKDVTAIAEEIISLYQEAKHNKKTCGVLLDRVQATKVAIENLKMRSKDHLKFFTSENNVTLRAVFNDMIRIKEFIEQIYKLKGIRKFIEPNKFESTFVELTEDFDAHMQTLNLIIKIDVKHQAERDSEALLSDAEDVNGYLQQLAENPDEPSDKRKIIAMLKKFEEFTKFRRVLFDKNNCANQTLNIPDVPLEISDFDQTSETRGKVQKWMRKSIQGLEVAFKKLEANNAPMSPDLQIKLLKRIKDSREIIQFFGLIRDESNSSLYIVTEWAHYGSLREFYNNEEVDIRLKLQIALDVVRGLNFLEAYDIFHHDVRSDNVMIDHTKRAKVANFGMSRGFDDPTRGLAPTTENVRYMAPEKIKNHKHKYNSQCEAFSFGVLLWEIAEKKFPYHGTNLSEVALGDAILKKQIQLKFETDIPEEWKRLVSDATDHESYLRPDFKEMFKRIKRLNNSIISTSFPNDSSSAINNSLSRIDKVLSVEEAIRHTKSPKGSKEKAWESFYKYSQLNDMTAKYYKAYYLYNGLVSNFPTPKVIQQAASLFKEAADKGNLMLAQLDYAICLYKGEGVVKNIKLAHQYFLKAANNGHPKAMFNVGIMYYIGEGVEKDIEEGTYWLKEAAMNEIVPAINYCKRFNITF